MLLLQRLAHLLHFSVTATMVEGKALGCSAASAANSAVVAAITFLLVFSNGGCNAEQTEPSPDEVTSSDLPVKVSVFYESLCPDSRMFVLKQLFPTWLNLSEIMSLDMNAYGKAHEIEEGEHYKCSCQHGPDECAGNAMLNCAREYMTDEDHFIRFVRCIMREFKGAAAGEYCAKEVGLNYTETETCFDEGEAEDLLHQVGLLQATLEPVLSFVPWILINDVYTPETHWAALKDLHTVVCDVYEGTKPEVCLLKK